MFSVLNRGSSKELAEYSLITNATPVDKINFLRFYIAARKDINSSHIKSAWRVTGNWPISRPKALVHEEIQHDHVSTPDSSISESTTQTSPSMSRQIRDLASKSSPKTRLLLCNVSKALDKRTTKLIMKCQDKQHLQAQTQRMPHQGRRKCPMLT